MVNPDITGSSWHTHSTDMTYVRCCSSCLSSLIQTNDVSIIDPDPDSTDGTTMNARLTGFGSVIILYLACLTFMHGQDLKYDGHATTDSRCRWQLHHLSTLTHCKPFLSGKFSVKDIPLRIGTVPPLRHARPVFFYTHVFRILITQN